VKDLVYVYTNSRVLNQNVPFTDEAATEWYMQTVVSEDSDSEGLVDLFDDYDDVSDFDIPNMSINDENIQGRLEEQDGLQQQAQGIREDGRDLQDWAAHNVNGPYVEPLRGREQSLPPANSIGGDASLSTNPILHGGQEVDNRDQDPNNELQDIGTSMTAPGDTMAPEERPMHDNEMPPINLVSSLRNELLIQGTDGGGPAHCVVLPSGTDGIDTEGNASFPTVENINTLNVALVGIQEVATHPMPPFQPRQLFKSPVSVPRRPVCIQPPMHPTLVAPDPSPCVRASDTAKSEDDLVLACIQSFQRNHASLASKMALPQGNVIVVAPHTTTVEQGDPSSHMQPMHETILARDTSTPPLQVVPPTIPSRASTRSKSKNAPQSSLGHVANLRGQVLPRQSTTSMGPHKLMLSCDVEATPTNNPNNGNKRPLPIRALRRARRPRKDGPRRGSTKQTKRIKSASGPTQDKTKTKKLVEFGCGGSDSDDIDAELSSKNDDTSHAEAPSDSTYCEGD
jgi:hypothetical protein